jgi:hypothetical protein
VGSDDSVCLQLRILRLLKQVVRGFGESIKAGRKALVVLGHGTLQANCKTTCEVGQGQDIPALHDGQQFLRLTDDPAFRAQGNTIHDVGREGQVGMEIDDRISAARHLRFFQVEHAYRLVLGQS